MPQSIPLSRFWQDGVTILPVSVEYVEKLYNRYSSFYDLLFGKIFHSGRELAPVLLNLFPGARLLEVGVGTGLSFPMLPKNIQLTGIDLSEKMLQHAQRRVKSLRLNGVELVKMDAAHLKFPNNSFDRVLAAYFVSTVPDPVKVILEMKRVCKPGGYLVFMNHFRYENRLVSLLENLISPFCYRIGFRTDLDLYQLMAQAGLEIEFVDNIDFLGHWKAVRCISRCSSGRGNATTAPILAANSREPVSTT